MDTTEVVAPRDGAAPALPTPTNEFLSGLVDLAAAIDAATDLKSLLKILARKTAAVCQVDRCSIFLWRDEQLVPTMAQFASGTVARHLWRSFKNLGPYQIDQIPALGRALNDGRVVLLEETGDGGAVPPPVADAFAIGSAVIIPLVRRDALVGVLVLDNGRGGRPIRGLPAWFARAIAAQAALAIDNARLLGQTRDRLQETETLLTIGHVISSTLDLGEVARRITREAARTVGADSAGIYIDDAHALRPLAGYRIPKEFLESLRTEAVFHLGAPRPGRFLKAPFETLWSDDVPNNPAFRHAAFQRFPLQSIVITPLHARDEWVGVLVCAWWRRRRRLVPEKLRLLEGLAAQAAVAIVNARLYAKAEAMAVERERTRMDGVLHDTLSQTLFSVALRLGLALRGVRSAALRAKLEAMKQDVALMMAQIRELLSPSLSPEGFSARIARLVDEFRKLSGIPVDLALHGDMGRIGPPLQESMLKSLEEALAGIAKHRQPRRVFVRLEMWTDEVQFELAEEDATAPAGIERLVACPTDLGLEPLFQRIAGLRGEIEFWDSRPFGFRLRGTVPVS